MSAKFWALTTTAGLGLLVAAAIGFAGHHSVPAEFGTMGPPTGTPARAGQVRAGLARVPREPVITPTETVGTPPAPVRTSAVPTGNSGTEAPSARTTPVPSIPVALAIPTLHVHAPVVPVATTAGELGVPHDPAQVGWWSSSALPGAAGGSIVIDGHVDSAAAGPGALFRLTDLRAGQPVTITTAGGGLLRYTVVGRRVYAKEAGLPADLFTRTGPSRLVLITCGGPFDRDTGSYLDNIAVFATPVPA